MKKIALLFVLILIISHFVSCAERRQPTCRQILGELIQSEIGLPAGRVYSARAEEGNEEYLPVTLIARLFGDGSAPAASYGWLDIALFLPSSSHPCEFAVILCDSEDTATDTSRLLCRRLDAIRNAKGGGEHAGYLDDARVSVIKNYVLLIISSDVENAIRVASKTIG